MAPRFMPNSKLRVAVIGAGIAGLSCARRLQESGRAEVELFEKSRGVGGRAATRRQSEEVQFDHGAQYFTARDPRFQSAVVTWRTLGVVAEWKGMIVSLDEGRVTAGRGDTVRYVGVPGMSSLARHLSQNLSVRTQVHVERLERHEEGWYLSDDGHRYGPFDRVVCTAPPAQTLSLLAQHSNSLASALAAVRMLPCWAVLAQFSQRLPVDWDGAFVQDAPLSWIARNSSKPGRPSRPETWVLHASPVWSERYLELSPDEACVRLWEAFTAAMGGADRVVDPTVRVAHRWRYAIPDEPLDSLFLQDSEAGLAVAGDWCGGPRIEGAYLSGLELAADWLGSQGIRSSEVESAEKPRST
jgi:renalase